MRADFGLVFRFTERLALEFEVGYNLSLDFRIGFWG